MIAATPEMVATLRERGFALGPVLGRGAGSVVYQAGDLRHQRQVAIKVLREDAVDESAVERFLGEIGLVARLNHPHIVPLFDSGEAGGRPYYVMPLFEGETLRSRLQRDGRLEVAEAVSIAIDVADALAYAHNRRIIHRDIKPENILLQGGHATVADFGIARAMFLAAHPTDGDTSDSGQGGEVLGTPAYMSPEQFGTSDAVDARSDLYSLGAVVFEMLTGQLAAEAPRARSGSPSVRASRSDLPATLDAAVRRAMAPDPADRFGSANDMIAALRRASGTGPPSRLAVAAGVVAVLGLAVLGRQLWNATQGPELSHGRVVVAILSNETGDPSLDAIGDQAADLITERLARLPDMKVATSANQRPAVRNQSLAAGSAARDPDQLRALALETGAGYVVSGSYYRADNHLEFFVEVTDAVEGLLARAIGPVPAPIDKPEGAIDSAATAVTAVLDSLARYHAPRR